MKMKVYKIKLQFELVNGFCMEMGMFESEINVSQGKCIVDAKSVMGVFSMDVSSIMTVEFYPCNTHEDTKFEDIIRKYTVSCVC